MIATAYVQDGGVFEELDKLLQGHEARLPAKKNMHTIIESVKMDVDNRKGMPH
jgi:hypothetical protein